MNKMHRPTQSGEWSVSRTKVVVVVVLDGGVE